MARLPSAALPLLASALVAQEPAFGDLEALKALRDTPVIAASRREQSLLQSPQAIEVITADQIRASGVFRLLDLLKLTTAVQVWDETPTRANVTLRGLNPLGSPRTLQVLVDGVPLFNLMATPLDFNGLPVPLDAIDRVEIVRGPSSSLYGANAQMGVISIITKRARPGLEVGLRSGFADHGTARGELFLAHGTPTFGLTLGAAAASSRDFGRPLQVIGQPGVTIPQDTANREQQLFLRSEWSPGPGRVWLAFGYGDAGHFSETTRSTTTLEPLTVLPDQSVRREITQLGWAHSWSPRLQTEVHLQQKVFRLPTEAMEALPGEAASAAALALLLAVDPAFGRAHDFYRDRIREATLQVNWDPGDRVHAVFGADAKTIQSIPNLILGLPEARRERAQGAFASLEWESGALTLGGGARAEHDTLGGSRLSPRASAVWQLDAASTLRLGWFTSTRSPTIQERHSALGDIPIIAYVLLPNPDLEPETAESLELGYRRFGAGWSLGVTAFRTALRHLIAQVPIGGTSGGKPLQMYRNNPERIVDQGLELSLQGQPAPDWRLGFNLATAAVEDPIYGSGRQADYSPRFTANLWSRWQRAAWFAYLGLNHVAAYTASTPFGSDAVRSQVPARTQVQFHVGGRPLPNLSLSLYGVNATRPTADSAPLGLSNLYGLRYARRELGVQAAWRY